MLDNHITRAFSNMVPFPSRTRVRQTCTTDVLDVQLKQANSMTSAENVNKLYNFVLKYVWTEHLKVKLTMIVYPERAYKMFTSSQTSGHFDLAFRKHDVLL